MDRTSRQFSDRFRLHGYALDVRRDASTGKPVHAVLTAMPRLPASGYERVMVAYPMPTAVDLFEAWVREARS